MLDNGVYATTGGQPVPNADVMEYHVVAQGCGYPATYSIDNLEDFANQIDEIMSQPGPVFVALKIDPEIINEPINNRPQWQRKNPQPGRNRHAGRTGDRRVIVLLSPVSSGKGTDSRSWILDFESRRCGDYARSPKNSRIRSTHHSG